jgi:glycosyltransferase involved in cell wall biosynthesis
MMNGKIVAIVVPAYNAGKTIGKTLDAIPRDVADMILAVDDGSRDDSAAIARAHGAEVLSHPKNAGYGAAQKTGYGEALRRGADIVVMVHSDFQYDPTLVPEMVRPIAEGRADACFGSRMHRKRDALKGGMPLWRFVANVALTWIEERFLHLHLSEYHTGYRAYGRKIFERIPYQKLSDNYVFDTEMLASLAGYGFRTAEIPIPTRYLADSQSPNFRKSVVYGLSTLGVMVRYLFGTFRP